MYEKKCAVNSTISVIGSRDFKYMSFVIVLALNYNGIATLLETYFILQCMLYKQTTKDSTINYIIYNAFKLNVLLNVLFHFS